MCSRMEASFLFVALYFKPWNPQTSDNLISAAFTLAYNQSFFKLAKDSAVDLIVSIERSL